MAGPKPISLLQAKLTSPGRPRASSNLSNVRDQAPPGAGVLSLAEEKVNGDVLVFGLADKLSVDPLNLPLFLATIPPQETIFSRDKNSPRLQRLNYGHLLPPVSPRSGRGLLRILQLHMPPSASGSPP